jgi:hypothetical protein
MEASEHIVNRQRNYIEFAAAAQKDSMLLWHAYCLVLRLLNNIFPAAYVG